MIRIGYRKGLTLASAVGASLLVTAAASAKSAPRMPHGPARPVEQATVLHVQSNAVEVKVQGPGPRGQSKTLTIKSSRFSAKSPLAFSHLKVGQHIVLSSTSSGWKVSKAPTPPLTGTVQKVSGTSLVIKEAGRTGPLWQYREHFTSKWRYRPIRPVQRIAKRGVSWRSGVHPEKLSGCYHSLDAHPTTGRKGGAAVQWASGNSLGRAWQIVAQDLYRQQR